MLTLTSKVFFLLRLNNCSKRQLLALNSKKGKSVFQIYTVVIVSIEKKQTREQTIDETNSFDLFLHMDANTTNL